jgi:2-C-methyl-D-erythritol 4-phosphate cytidylyltransferase / 2-C-methyl-D-erythritol 2,4-cyclodiphosphate synthase
MPDGVVAVVVVAGGRGLRAGGDRPKQYRLLGHASMLRHSLEIFADHAEVALIQPVIHRDDQDLFRETAQGLDILAPAFGGATRQDSVRAGLEALEPHRPAVVLIHDAARPFASAALISRAIVAGRGGAAIPGLKVSDTIKEVDADNRVINTPERARLRAVQTPQAFDFARILAIHRQAQAAGRSDFTDDGALAEWAGLPVTIFEGETGNIKMTTHEDFARHEAQQLAALGDVRVGSGYDVHAFTEGDHVWLGGLKIPHTQGVLGHSDADVVLHAAVDAILGALADGDIGAHFPPSDPQWKGASSDRFLKFAVERLAARGGRLMHLDVTVVCEAPKVGPHRDAMRARIADIAGVDVDRVAVKATTSEKMGFTGRREGLVAYATATVRLPWSGG